MTVTTARTPARRPTRRTVLTAAGAAAIATACTPTSPGSEVVDTTTTSVGPESTTIPTSAPATTAPATTTPTTPPAPGKLSPELLIDKLTFGPTPGLRDEILAVGMANWIEQQLNPVGSGVPDAEGLLAGYATLGANNRTNYAYDGAQFRRSNQELQHAFTIRSTYSHQQLFEVMCEFWHNHFSLYLEDTTFRCLKSADYATTIRRNALGKFSDMLQASVKSPAMLRFLDQFNSNANSAAGVNVNYARELLELHTLGIIDRQQVYTEADVRSVAMLLSGNAIEFAQGGTYLEYKFAFSRHPKVALSILGGAWTRPANPTQAQAIAQQRDFVNFLAHHESTARYLCLKICRRFIGDNPPMSLVNAAAKVYLANDTAIVPVLRFIFASPEFLASGGAKLRNPFEQMIAGFRALNARVSSTRNGQAATAINDMQEIGGRALFYRLTPDGYPDTAQYWSSSESVLRRWEFAAHLASNTITNPILPEPIAVDLPSLLPATLPATAGELVIELAARVGNYVASPADAAAILSASGLTTTSAATALTTSSTRMATTFGLLLSHPSFQHR